MQVGFVPTYETLGRYLDGEERDLSATTALLLWSGASYLVKDLLLQRRMRVYTDQEAELTRIMEASSIDSFSACERSTTLRHFWIEVPDSQSSASPKRSWDQRSNERFFLA